MKIIINENRLNKVVLNWLNIEFGNVTEIVKGEYTLSANQAGDVLISYLTNVKEVVLIDYIRIWRLLINIFGMKSEQIQDILKIWLEETYNLKEIMPLPIFR